MAKYKNHNVAERLVRQFNNNQSSVALAVGASRQAVNQWMEKGFIPPRWALTIEKVSGGLITANEVMETAIYVQDPNNREQQKG